MVILYESRHLGDILPPRFWDKVRQEGDCWLWTAYTTGGYGRFRANRQNWAAHRLAYEELVAPIPNGLVLDHLCRNRTCINPDHLDPVTPGVNVLRGETFVRTNAEKTHCINGHEYTPDNTGSQSSSTPKRYCKQCERNRNVVRKEWRREYYRNARGKSK